MSDYSNKNAEAVLANVKARIKEMENDTYTRARGYKMSDVCSELSIFDWWTDRLTISRLKQMRSFLLEAVKLGYTGYVCFKVGMSGCANGMWASTEESTDGYSPRNGKTLYRSFTPAYTYWDFDNGDGFTHGDYSSIKELEAALLQ